MKQHTATAHTHPDKTMPHRPRLVPRRGRTPLVKVGGERRHGDFYARLMDMSWSYVTAIIIGYYLAANTLFALAYMEIPEGIENARPGSFQDAFFFSVQTMATIGYGKLVPVSMPANILVTLEALFGFGFFAVVTGLLFAKFSRPTARVLFSNIAVICPYNGTPHLMIRLANQRENRIVDASAQLVVLRTETTAEGLRMRRFYDMKLVRNRVPFMQLTWTLMHPIDKDSPLFGLSAQQLCDKDSEIVISLLGLDETFAQPIHARHSYVTDEIVFDASFEDILRRLEDGRTEINFHRFHQYHMLKSTE
jgi:inward rectifier potassium channel